MDLGLEEIRTISQRVLADLKESLGDPKYFMGASPLKGLAYAMSGISYMLHAHINDVAKFQLFPDTARGENLDRWAKIFGLTRAQATPAQGQIAISGNPSYPLTFISGAGEEYKASSPPTLSDGKIHCESVKSGLNQNLSPRDLLFLKDSNLSATVLDPGITGGNDLETDDELRARVLYRFLHPPRGGTKSDYLQWVQNCKGFTPGKAWIYPAFEGPGNVGVTLMTKSYKTPFPTTDELNLVKKDLESKIPITTSVTVYPLIQKQIDFRLIFTNPSHSDLAKDAILHLLFESALPETTLTLSRLNYTLSNALKGEGYTLVSPASDISFRVGECGVIGGWIAGS